MEEVDTRALVENINLKVMPTSVSLMNKTVVSEVCDLNTSRPVPLGGSEHAQRQLYRALRYHTLQDPQLHNTLKDMLASVRTAGKGLSTAARLYLARREFTLGLRWSLNISCNFAAKFSSFLFYVLLQVFIPTPPKELSMIYKNKRSYLFDVLHRNFKKANERCSCSPVRPL